jgi:hypothetical protein
MTFSGLGSGTAGDPYQITSWGQLDEMRNDLDKHFILMNDLDENTIDYVGIGDGSWESIGVYTTRFTGSLDGKNHYINDFKVVGPSSSSHDPSWGLFGWVDDSGVIKNIRMENININGYSSVGGICCWTNGVISNCHILSGNILGHNGTAGICSNGNGTIEYCSNKAEVDGTRSRPGWTNGSSGGIAATSVVIKNCYNEGTVKVILSTVNHTCGGIIGKASKAISNCYNKGDVIRTSGSSYKIAGIAGEQYRTTLDNCYNTGKVIYEGADNPTDKGVIAYCDNTWDVRHRNNFFDIDTSEQLTSAVAGLGPYESRATGKTTAEMKSKPTFDAASWTIASGRPLNEGYPYLAWQDNKEGTWLIRGIGPFPTFFR